MADRVRTVTAAPKAPKKSVVESVFSLMAKASNSLLSLLSGLLAAFLILYSGYVLYDTFYTQNQAFSNSWDLMQYRPEIIDDNSLPLTSALSSLNMDYRAWLTVFDTGIDYPVMQGKDDLYYANHDIYGNSSLTGAIYLAAGNNAGFLDSYNIVYGHHMDNGAMFGGLDKFTNADYSSSHRTGVLVTGSTIYDLNIFAMLSSGYDSSFDAYVSAIYAPGNRTAEVLDYLRAHAAWLDESVVDDNAKIVALSTCASADTNGRLVVFATMTEREHVRVSLDNVTWVYDGTAHSVSAAVNNTDGTVIEYSTDGGATWSTTPPTITNVGELTVKVRAVNSIYGSDEDEATLRVTPKTVTVKADPAEKVFGEADPVFTAKPTELLGDDTIAYTVTREGTDENTGTYPNAIVPVGEEFQGNYRVRYEKANFTITRSDALIVTATGYNGVYDGAAHAVTATVNIPAGTTIEYSTDGGTTWSTTPPTVTNVGELTVQVRTTNPNYDRAEATVILRVTPKAVTVKADAADKVFGGADPVFTAQVTGLLGDDTVAYTVTREGTDENTGTYENAIVPAGEELQGNYAVTYIPANLTITPADTLTLTATGYNGAYDGAAHAVTATANIPADTVIEYSTDGGTTWSTTPPAITNVGELTVQVRATNPNYDRAEATVTLQVTPAAVTVTVNAAAKVFGEDDPTFSAQVTGLLGDDTIAYTVTRPGAGQNENAGTYPNAIVSAGEELQGNYAVTYVPANFTITPATNLRLTARGYVGIYDGTAHAVTASANIAEGTVIEYRVNGGAWTTEAPSLTNVGSLPVQIRAVHPNYRTATAAIMLRVTPKTVTVTAEPAEKLLGEDDPTFTATVDGVLNGDTVAYTVTRPNAGTDEDIGTYEKAIVPAGAESQGNYILVFKAADFIIRDRNVTVPRATPSPTEGNAVLDILDPERALENIGEAMTPLANFMNTFHPNGGTGSRAWALVNLICLLLTIYLFIPLNHLKAKFGRAKTMRRFNRTKEELREAQSLDERAQEERERILQAALEERKKKAGVMDPADITAKEFGAAVEKLYYPVRRFARRFRAGFCLELVDSLVALVVFLVTEDMRLPMILIDKWTPLMILFLALCWVADVRLARYRDELPEAEQAEEKQPATV